MWFAYNLLFTLGFLLLLPRFFQRMLRRGGYGRDFGHRLGRYTPALRGRLAEGGRVWVHAVSVGELFVALAFLKEWRRRRPGVRFVLSTTTSTAYALAGRRLAPEDALIYFPVDFPPVMNRVLGLMRPSAVVLMETEIWPNLIRLAAGRGVPVFLVNGRLSARSARRYGLLRTLTRRLLPRLRGAFMQSDVEVRRLLDLGADPARVHSVGTAKYDVALADDGAAVDTSAVRTAGGVLMGGSTWAGEEVALLDAFVTLRRDHPQLSLVLAPRHAERRAGVVAEAQQRGLRLVTRSSGLPQGDAEVFLLDTTGELKSFYACADVIFVGKSLTEHGGQNPIEPAVAGKAIVVGPNMENFPGVMADFLQAGALVQVQDVAGLNAALAGLLGDSTRRRQLGDAARRVVETCQGSLGRTLDRLLAEAQL
jgi:3-deoxy-D-manno-octulosonic-acid transferase